MNIIRNNATKDNIIFLLTVKSAVAFIYDDATMRQGLEKMRHHGYTALPVISGDGKYVGTVSEGDFLWHILDSGDNSMKLQENYPILEILRRGWNPAVNIRATMDELLIRVSDQNFVPVVDDRGVFMGIITRKSVIRHYCERRKAGVTGSGAEKAASVADT